MSLNSKKIKAQRKAADASTPLYFATFPIIRNWHYREMGLPVARIFTQDNTQAQESPYDKSQPEHHQTQDSPENSALPCGVVTHRQRTPPDQLLEA